MPQAAAHLFVVLSLFVAAFHVTLILGAPWGEYTLGGRWRGALPAPVRLIPLVSVVVLAGLDAITVARAGLALRELQPFADTWIWGVVAFCALGSVANAVTPSRRERAVWLPVVVCMLGLSLVVATS